MSNNKRTPPKQPYQPSFITPPPPHRNLYGDPSESQGTNAESNADSNATEVLSDESLTPPLSQYNEAGEASSAETATPSGPRLKKTANSGCRVAEGRFTRNGLYWRRNIQKNGSTIDVPCDECGNTVANNDPARIARREIVHVGTHLANLSSATPLSRRNVVARAAASATAEALDESEESYDPSALFSPAAASATARPSVLSLTPRHRPPRNDRNSPRQHTNRTNQAKKNRTGGKRHTYRKQRKQRKGKTYRKQRKQRKEKTRRS